MIIRENRIEHALNTLENGGVIIHETDTLYGFAVDATNTHAINKLNSLKGRYKPLSIMLNKIEEINCFVLLNNVVRNKLKNILPGPFTILLDSKKNKLSDKVQNGSKKLGIRIPNNSFCLEMLNKFKKPIVTTSVNIHGEPALNNLEDIERKYSVINIYPSDNILNPSLGSTIIDFTLEPEHVIRYGDGKY